jgi:hypothetical protein
MARAIVFDDGGIDADEANRALGTLLEKDD